MSQENETGIKAFTAGEDLEAYRRVKLDGSGNAVYSDAGEKWLGTTVKAADSGTSVAVKLQNFPGTRKMVCAGALTFDDAAYGADDGKIDDNPTGEPVGIPLETATADGDIIEVLTFPNMPTQATDEAVEVIGGAGNIAALNLVYVSDQTDAIMTVLKAQATSGGRFADFICPNAITAAAKGVALKKFLLQGIDTSGAGAVGDPVYLSDSAAGGYTLTKPTATDKVQIVGRVVEKHASTGAILFDLSGPQQVEHDHSSAAEGGSSLGSHTIKDGSDIAVGTTTGTKIGTATDQKLGFFNATPVVQPAHNADPAATAADPDAMTATDPTLDASDIDDQSGGTPNGSHQLVDVATDTWDNEKADVENNFSTIAAEYNSLKDDVEANEAALEALIDDVTSIRTQLVALIDDVQANNAAIDALNADAATLGLTAAS